MFWDMMDAPQAVLGLAAAAVGFAGAVFSGRVLWNLLRTGPGAAEDAYAKGDSVPNWLNASQVMTNERPKQEERFRFAGRSGRTLYGRSRRTLGDELVEERASYSRHAH